MNQKRAPFLVSPPACVAVTEANGAGCVCFEQSGILYKLNRGEKDDKPRALRLTTLGYTWAIALKSCCLNVDCSPLPCVHSQRESSAISRLTWIMFQIFVILMLLRTQRQCLAGKLHEQGKILYVPKRHRRRHYHPLMKLLRGSTGWDKYVEEIVVQLWFTAGVWEKMKCRATLSISFFAFILISADPHQTCTARW